jgi:hypothetical protein
LNQQKVVRIAAVLYAVVDQFSGKQTVIVERHVILAC